MRKIFFILPLFFFLTFPVLAKSQNSSQNSNSNSNSNKPVKEVTPTVSVNPIVSATPNLTAVPTTQATVSPGKTRGEGLQERNENALEHMSEVSKQVQLLLQVKTTGGIGEQVREIAREQNQAQNQIGDELKKLENRNGFYKRLFGPDYKAIKNLNRQIEQNQLRIRLLEQLSNQVQNQAGQTQLQETIQALNEQNTLLREQMKAEEKINSLFGWLFKLLAK